MSTKGGKKTRPPSLHLDNETRPLALSPRACCCTPPCSFAFSILSHSKKNSLHRALAALDAADERFARIRSAAEEAAPGAGESDLRRLKRQFTSLKNTFTLYDVKDGFIDGLAEGGPDGGEAARLAEFESQAAEFGAAAKAAKAANGAAADALRGLVDRVCEAHAAFEEERATVARALEELELAREEAEEATATTHVAEVEEQDEETEAATTANAPAAAELAAEDQRARELEARIAAAEAEAASLSAAAASEAAEAASLGAEAERMVSEEGGGSSVPSSSSSSILPSATADERLAEAATWCDEAAALMSALSGVRFVDLKPSSSSASLASSKKNGNGNNPTAALTLSLLASADACDGGGERVAAGPPPSERYSLVLHLGEMASSSTSSSTSTSSNSNPNSSPNSNGPTVVSVELRPPHFDVSDIPAVAAAAAGALAGGVGGAGAPAAAVAEVSARASARLKRLELLEEAAAAFAITTPLSSLANPTSSASSSELVAVLSCGVEATVSVPRSWPRSCGNDQQQRLRLTKLAAPRSDADLSPALASLRERERELGEGSVCALLAAASAACEGII